MKRQGIMSSNIKAVGYEGDVLEVEFSTGSVYRYKGVPRPVYEGLMASESKGKYFHANIRALFTGVRVPQEEIDRETKCLCEHDKPQGAA
jgi:hypothetical protein